MMVLNYAPKSVEMPGPAASRRRPGAGRETRNKRLSNVGGG